MSKHCRIHHELSEFLQQKRESITPESVGLPSGKRRRTPGLRREEVAALSGVGLTWYTWFEQGRDIRVSTDFLDRLAHVFALKEDERAHLYVLAHQRPPLETGKTVHHVPDNVQRLMADLPDAYIAYVLNLHWDVLGYNQRASHYFNFNDYGIYQRNFIGLLFTMPVFRARIANWETTAYQLLSSFRHDYIRSKEDHYMQGMIDMLLNQSPDFTQMWARYDICEPNLSIPTILWEGVEQQYESIILTFDPLHTNRLVIHMPK